MARSFSETPHNSLLDLYDKLKSLNLKILDVPVDGSQAIRLGNHNQILTKKILVDPNFHKTELEKLKSSLGVKSPTHSFVSLATYRSGARNDRIGSIQSQRCIVFDMDNVKDKKTTTRKLLEDETLKKHIWKINDSGRGLHVYTKIVLNGKPLNVTHDYRKFDTYESYESYLAHINYMVSSLVSRTHKTVSERIKFVTGILPDPKAGKYGAKIRMENTINPRTGTVVTSIYLNPTAQPLDIAKYARNITDIPKCFMTDTQKLTILRQETKKFERYNRPKTHQFYGRRSNQTRNAPPHILNKIESCFMIPEGHRNNTVFSLALIAKHSDISKEDFTKYVKKIKFENRFTEEEILTTIDSAYDNDYGFCPARAKELIRWVDHYGEIHSPNMADMMEFTFLIKKRNYKRKTNRPYQSVIHTAFMVYSYIHKYKWAGTKDLMKHFGLTYRQITHAAKFLKSFNLIETKFVKGKWKYLLKIKKKMFEFKKMLLDIVPAWFTRTVDMIIHCDSINSIKNWNKKAPKKQEPPDLGLLEAIPF